MSVRRPVLRYHGGKFKMGAWIVGQMPPHRIYVEPFGGGGSVLMLKPRSYAEVYNDLWDTVVNVFQIMRDPIKAAALKEQLVLTPFSRREFEACGQIEIDLVDDEIEKARRTILRSFAGFGSASTNAKYSTGFRGCSNRSGTTPAHDWVNYPSHIDSFIARLRGVVIECRNATDVIIQHDTPETLHFVDPPYLHITRNMQRGNAAYEFEMTDKDHIALAEVLRAATGMVMLCGYPSKLYQDLFGDWLCVERTSMADGARKRTECLWFNPAAQAGASIQGQLLEAIP